MTIFERHVIETSLNGKLTYAVKWSRVYKNQLYFFIWQTMSTSAKLSIVKYLSAKYWNKKFKILVVLLTEIGSYLMIKASNNNCYPEW